MSRKNLTNYSYSVCWNFKPSAHNLMLWNCLLDFHLRFLTQHLASIKFAKSECRMQLNFPWLPKTRAKKKHNRTHKAGRQFQTVSTPLPPLTPHGSLQENWKALLLARSISWKRQQAKPLNNSTFSERYAIDERDDLRSETQSQNGVNILASSIDSENEHFLQCCQINASQTESSSGGNKKRYFSLCRSNKSTQLNFSWTLSWPGQSCVRIFSSPASQLHVFMCRLCSFRKNCWKW